MILLLGALLMALAILLRAGHESLRQSSRIRLRHMIDEGTSGARVAGVHLDHPEYLNVVLSAWETALTISGALLLAAGTLGGRGIAVHLTGLVLLAFGFAALMALAAALARSAGDRMAEALAPLLEPFVLFSARVFPPLSEEEIAAGAAAYASADGEREAVEELIEEGLREGIGDREDMKLVSGVLELRETRVADVMVPRHDIFALSLDLPPAELATRMASSGYSRVPLYSGDLDTVAGIFHVLDVLKTFPRDLPPVRPVFYTEQSERCSDLLMTMLRQQTHICVVTDGNGHTTGLVALEDLLEEIVGEIRDEFDEPAPAVVAQVRS